MMFGMSQYAMINVTSSFDDVMQQWPGEENDGNFPFQAKNMTNIYVSFGEFCF